MNRKLTAALLVSAAVLTTVAFTALGSIFDYPDILKEPVDDILAAFRASQGPIIAWFTVLALSAALFAPIAIGVGRLAANRAMRLAVPVGIAAAVVQVVGLARWPLLVPGYAASGNRDAFATAHRLLGTLIGETLGYALTAAWTLLVLVALGRSIRRPVVPGARRCRRRADPGRRAVPPPCAGCGPGQLHRIHPVEPVARGVRHRPGPPSRRGQDTVPGLTRVLTRSLGADLAR